MPSDIEVARLSHFEREAAALVDAFADTEAVLTLDGRRLVFVSDRDGLSQLYLGDMAHPEAAPVRLTDLGERVRAPIPTPDGRSVLFCSDKGADERWSIYRIDLDGRGLVNLTPEEGLDRDIPSIPADHPDIMFYSARAPSQTGSAVYSQPLVGATAPTLLYTSPLPGALLDVTPDSRWGLFMSVASRTDIRLLVLDLQERTARQIHPREGAQATVLSARFSADGARVLVSTDGGGEEALVLALERRTGRELARYVEIRSAPARIPQLRVSAKGDRVAVNVQAGSRHEIRLLDARTLRETSSVRMPLGSGSLGEFTADGRRLTLIWSTPNVPAEAWAVDVARGEAAPLRKERRPALEPLPPLETSVISIPTFDSWRVPLNLYLPADPGGARAPRPVLVSIHGGPASYAGVRWSAAHRFFGSLGYAVVEPNIRGSSGFGRAYEMADDGPKRMDAVHDVEMVARWVAEQPWADGRRLVITGASYGGYIVLMALAHQPETWRAGIDMFGISNLRTFISSTTGAIREIFKLEFGEIEKDGALLDATSPIRSIDKIVAPLFVYAGANDLRVPRAESDQVVSALRARGVPVEYMIAEDEGHSLERRKNRIEFMARTARFLEKHIGPPQAP